jgi:hypothetical protein
VPNATVPADVTGLPSETKGDRMTSPACPVHAAALHLWGLSNRHDRAEEFAYDAYAVGDEEARRIRQDTASTIYAGIIEVQRAAMALRADSALGAILQLGLMADQAEHLYSLVDFANAEASADADNSRKAVWNMAYSLCDFIERTCGVRREDVDGETYLPRNLDVLNPATAEAA